MALGDATDTADTDMPAEIRARLHPKRKWPRRLLKVLLALALLFAGWHVTIRWKVRRELAKVPAGEPMSLEALDDWYPTPEGENAANAYGTAFMVMVPLAQAQKKFVPIPGEAELLPGQPMPADMRAAIKQHVTANAGALKQLHSAARIPECRYPIDMTQGFYTRLPHLAQCRGAARLLSLQGMLAAEKGDAETATRALHATLALADSLRNEPYLISMLVRLALLEVATRQLEQTLSRTELTGPRLAALQQAFAQAQDPDALWRALVAERATGHTAFGNLVMMTDAFDSMNLKGYRAAVVMVPYILSGVREYDHYVFLRTMNRHIEAAKAPSDEMLRRTRPVETHLIDLPKVCALSRRLLRILTQTSKEHLKGVVLLRAAETACAVERFRLAEGRLPKTLDKLVPTYLDAVPLDVFRPRKAPLRCVCRKGGVVVIYSISTDRKDDGGPGHNHGDVRHIEDVGVILVPRRGEPAK